MNSMNIRKVAFCMLMLIVAYTGPRPIYHSHEKFLELVGGGSSLTKHLAQYHQSHSNCPSPQSVHCHWICCDFFDTSCVTNSSASSGFVATECETLFQHDLNLQFLNSLDFVVADDIASTVVANSKVESVDSFTNPLQVLQCFCVWIC